MQHGGDAVATDNLPLSALGRFLCCNPDLLKQSETWMHWDGREQRTADRYFAKRQRTEHFFWSYRFLGSLGLGD